MYLSTIEPSILRRQTIAGHSVVWRKSDEIIGRFSFRAFDELAPIEYKDQLREGLEMELEGAWFEIFMFDHVRERYAIERIA